MESNSTASAREMNGKDKRNGPSEKVSFQLVLEILKSVRRQEVYDRIIVIELTVYWFGD